MLGCENDAIVDSNFAADFRVGHSSRLVKTRRRLLFGITAIVGVVVCAWFALKMTADINKAEQVGKAYQPVRDGSTFEFTVEYVGAHDDGAMAFGLVTKGTLHEGYRLRLIRQSGEERDCLCRAIAGLSERLSNAGSEGEEKNIGIWLDIPPGDVKPRDRIISFDMLTAARQIAPADLQFSILHGVQKRKDDES